MNAEKTGSFIAELRKERGLTQKKLADRLLVSDKAISRWETGHGMPDLDNLEAISCELGVSVAELLRGERIVEAVEPDEAAELAQGGLELVKQLLRKRTAGNLLIGFLTGLIVVALLVVHLTAPIAIPYRDGIVRVDELDDGTLVALSSEDSAGFDVGTVDGSSFISSYTTRWHQIMGPEGSSVVALGEKGDIGAVLYYPGTPDDVLLYGQIDDAGVVTLPRLVNNMWLAVGIIAGVLGLASYALLRKRWYAKRILRIALLPVCFSVSLIAVLWGRFDQVYNASFYLSGICLVALALYAAALLALSRRATD